MKALREKLTYANVVATLALMIAVAGGGALAATRALPKNSVGTRQIRNHAVTRAKIKIASLGTVPRATAAAHATSAESAAHATSADTARDAESLGGLSASSYARAELESIHVVGSAGQPGFEDGCAGAGGDFGQVGFYKDGLGIVHLVGLASCPSAAATVFTLPPGFRPAVDNLMAVAMSETTSGEVGVLPDGEVQVFGGAGPRLFGVTFRAAP
ncbi:MAG: hypothetical protein QM729_18695 [Solirubrobacterales bacterium]